MDDGLPPYVCCVVTEGVWTIFWATFLIVVFFTIATLKYLKKYLSKSKFYRRNVKLMSKLVNEDGKNVAAIIRCDGAVAVKDFVEYCQIRRRKQRVNEYEFVKSTSTKIISGRSFTPTTSVAEEKLNMQLNQNSASVPFDHNRVKLKNRPSGTSDYINATAVDGVSRMGRHWIATQGPQSNTMGDFWEMIWQENSPVIVMLTKTFECIQVMCSQYWPLYPDRPEEYGDFKIRLLSEEKFAHYKISTLELTDNRSSEVRRIKHFHYLDWPVYIPSPDSSSFLIFVNHLHEELEYQEKERENHAPPIVHCHDGGGRTGTFLAIEANLFMVNNEDEVNIFETLQWLRTQRKSFISNPGQYRFVYNVIEDHVACGDTQIDTSKLSLQVSMLTNYIPTRSTNRRKVSNMNGFEREYKQLSNLRPRFTIGDCAAGHRIENRPKNRNAVLVPPDERRPYLTSFQNTGSGGGGDYINAVFVDGFTFAKDMVCTEWPMSNTIANFWSMIYDHDVTTVVVLDPYRSHSITDELHDYGRFWPTDPNPKTHGSMFSISMKKHSEVQGCCDYWDLGVRKVGLLGKSIPDISGCFDLKKLESKSVALFQLATGSERGLPDRKGFLQMIMDINDWQKNNRRITNKKMMSDGSAFEHRTVVVSHDGIAKIGIYCTAIYCFEQAESRGLVDVFQAVRNVKKYRPQLVPNAQEYQYCYDLVLDYVRKLSNDNDKVI